MFSRGDEISLPVGTNDLPTAYSELEEVSVAKRNDVYIDQAGAERYMLHQFKVFVGAAERCQVEWEGKSTLAPNLSSVYLQIYNHNSSSWQTVDSNGVARANIDFELEKKLRDTTNYKDAGGVLTARVYQLAI